jgi:hypothetical protein
VSVLLPESLQAARLALVHKRPYLASIIWSLIPVARDNSSGLNTMAVDEWGRWYINIPEVSKWPLSKICLGIIHECNHLLRRHHDRMQSFAEWMTPFGISLANVGGDLEINDELAQEAKDFNTEAPEGFLYPKTFGFENGLFAEEYCEKLLRKAQKDGRCFNMPFSSSGGGKNQNKGQGGQQSQPGVGQGHCGSCSGSGQQPWEEGAPKGTQGGKSDTPGLTAPELDVIRRQVAQSVKEHSATRGDVPAGWKRWAEAELQPPQIPWTRELAAVIRRVQADIQGMVDYSWKRLSRRSTDEILLPGLRKPKVHAAAVVDTSGSMSEDDLTKCLREFAGVLKVVGCEGIPFYSVDAAIHVTKKVMSMSQVELAGGGGTDMRIGISAALKAKPIPDFVIVFTDGYTPWPDSPPANGTRVIAVLTRESGEPPGWIRSLHVN